MLLLLFALFTVAQARLCIKTFEEKGKGIFRPASLSDLESKMNNYLFYSHEDDIRDVGVYANGNWYGGYVVARCGWSFEAETEEDKK